MEKLVIMINTTSFERVAYALSFAIIAAARGTEVFDSLRLEVCTG